MSHLQKSSKIKDRPPNMAGVRFETGGAYFNFRLQIRVLLLICNFKKYGWIHRAKLHLAIFNLYGVVIFSTTLLLAIGNFFHCSSHSRNVVSNQIKRGSFGPKNGILNLLCWVSLMLLSLMLIYFSCNTLDDRDYMWTDPF